MPRKKDSKPRKPTPLPTPQQSEPWAQPPKPLVGDDTEEITFTAVGRAISAWEAFEISMAGLFARFLGIESDTLPARRAYGSVLTFRGRADMVQAAAEAYFFASPDTELSGEVADILRYGRGFSGRRNEVAHGIVRMIRAPWERPIFGGYPRQNNWGYAVVPSDYATNKTTLAPALNILVGTTQEPKYQYTSVEINAFAMHFNKLSERTSALARRVLKHSLQKPR